MPSEGQLADGSEICRRIGALSALILRELVAWSERALGRAPAKAVITVPASFSDAQRDAGTPELFVQKREQVLQLSCGKARSACAHTSTSCSSDVVFSRTPGAIARPDEGFL
jgi:hypothetical protein